MYLLEHFYTRICDLCTKIWERTKVARPNIDTNFDSSYISNKQIDQHELSCPFPPYLHSHMGGSG